MNATTKFIFSTANMAKSCDWIGKDSDWQKVARAGTKTTEYGPYFPGSMRRGSVHPDLLKAAMLLRGYHGIANSYALVKIGQDHYAAEYQETDTSPIQVMDISFINGLILACEVTGVDTSNIRVQSPGTYTASGAFDCTAFLLCCLAYVLDKGEAGESGFEKFIWANLNAIPEEGTAFSDPAEQDEVSTFLIGLSCTIQYGSESGNIKATIPQNGSCTMMTTTQIQNKKGQKVAGNPKVLQVENAQSFSGCTMGEAKKRFQSFSGSLQWTEEEKALIPEIPDDFPVPQEAIKIANRYIATANDRRPMKNFLWRAITSYGKSTGVECIAAMLGMPLLKMTCEVKTETQDFLSQFVPATQDNRVLNPGTDDGAVSFDDIAYDPAGTYELLTGTVKEDATSEEVLELYIQKRCGASAAQNQQFVRVESNYIQALAKGYIVEVQESSRIKDSGVLVGLNEFDRPGAKIPLVDGTNTVRHQNAMVIFTDNVGYDSCRPIDPSVIRRFAFVIDSAELSKETVLQRLAYNTGCKDTFLMEKLYDIWSRVQDFCKENEITEGPVSVSELEFWLRLVMLDGEDSIRDNFQDAVVSKATSNTEEQAAIIRHVDPYL